MANTIYFRVNKVHADYATIVSDSGTEHAIRWPNHALSVRPNLADTEAVIKVDCSTTSWYDLISWNGSAAILEIYSDDISGHTAHSVLSTLLHTVGVWEEAPEE